MHALEETARWYDYGSAKRNSPNLFGEFMSLWANLKRYHPEYTEEDRMRFYREFMKGAAR